jgi:hypothetical protein
MRSDHSMKYRPPGVKAPVRQDMSPHLMFMRLLHKSLNIPPTPIPGQHSLSLLP